MECRSSLPCSQEPRTGLYPEPVDSDTHILYRKHHLTYWCFTCMYCIMIFYIHSSYTVLLRCRGFHFLFFWILQIGRTSDRLVARSLPKYRTTQTQNKHAHTNTPNIHAHDHGLRASEDSSYLRLLSYRDRHCLMIKRLKKDSVALARKRTIPTERLPLVGEVSANLCG
jgi:hypothetical protein